MNSRFEQAITAGVLAGAIALAGCASGGGGDGEKDQTEPTPPTVVEANAYDLWSPFPAYENSLVIEFSEPVTLADASEAASAFTLAENMVNSTGDALSYYACVSASQGAAGPGPYTTECLDYASTSVLLSNRTGTAIISPGDSAKIVIDYAETGGITFLDTHGTNMLRLRFTDSESHPVQGPDGEALESFDFPDSGVPGNVTFNTFD